jgi:hypothetical protein
MTFCEGKKQLNQLIGFLDKGGAGKETLGGVRENQAFKTARAKRDAEEAGLLKNIFPVLLVTVPDR